MTPQEIETSEYYEALGLNSPSTKEFAGNFQATREICRLLNTYNFIELGRFKDGDQLTPSFDVEYEGPGYTLYRTFNEHEVLAWTVIYVDRSFTRFWVNQETGAIIEEMDG
jgi:hypothetical protein